MAKKILVDYDFSKNQIQNALLHPLSSAPGSPVDGQVYYNTTDDAFYGRANGAWIDLGIQGGAGATNLDSTEAPTTVTITSDTGNDAVIPAADGTNAGVMTSAMQVKLAGVATGATANDTDANLKNRANHTGTQSADTITDGTTNKVYTATEQTKLAGIEAAADVTDAANVASAIHGATAKTTPVANDEIGLIDSAASNALKRMTYANLSSAIVALIVDSAPGTLDTLNELAAALGDDPSFATTVTTSIATKAAKASNLSDLADAAAAFANIKQSASTTATGVAELATSTEAEARSDTARVLTPSSVANFPVKKIFTIGDGSATSIALTHSLGTKEVITQVRQASDDAVVECDIVNTSTTVTTLTFAVAPASNAIKAVVMG